MLKAGVAVMAQTATNQRANAWCLDKDSEMPNAGTFISSHVWAAVHVT